MIYNSEMIIIIIITFKITDYDLERRIKQAYIKDVLIKDVEKRPEKYPVFIIWNGFILYKGLIYITPQIHEMIIKFHHKEITAGHNKIKKTLKRISKTYYFLGMRKTI